MTTFDDEVIQRLDANGRNATLRDAATAMLDASVPAKYSYNFSWLGRPIIQYPQDIVAMQELTSTLQPDLIVETGIAHGGSLIFYASMLELNAACGGPRDASVVGVDIDIRNHNRAAIETHPMFKRIEMLQGSSIAPDIVAAIRSKASGKKCVLVCLDSNHTHDHVLHELEAYANLATVGSYCVVFDTLVENQPKSFCADRPWGPGDNPMTAVNEFLKSHPEFEIDRRIDHKLLLSAAPAGYLKRIR